MSLFRGLGGAHNQTPDYTGLQIQTAVSTLPVPIVWGLTKVAPNLIWYNNFQAYGGGGGKGFGNSGSEITYSASIIMALCEGPISGIGQIWRGRSQYTLAQLGFSLANGTNPQATWSYLTSSYPTQAYAYQSTAYVYEANYALGSSADLSNHNFEVAGLRYQSGANGIDADPAEVISDFLTSAQFGVGFPSSSIAGATLFGAGSDASLQTYCKGVGIALSPALTDQETASSILTRWLQICNCAAVWSSGTLRFIPYGDTATVQGTPIPTTYDEEIPSIPNASNQYLIFVTAPANWVSDQGVKFAISGSSLTYVAGSLPGTNQYCISPNGTYLFAGTNAGAEVTISYTYAIGASYVPNVTPIYNLAEEDYMTDPGTDPVKASVTDPYKAYNVVRLEIQDRANAYNTTPCEARNQNSIEALGANGTIGERVMPTVTAHEINDPNVGLIVAQLILQRSVYIRNTYKLRLSWEYCLLDPMDLVTLTEALLGMTNVPVRITEIEENDNGYLQITAEEFPLGVATATLYATQQVGNNPINMAAPAPAVSAPVIFEPPLPLGGGFELWIAVGAPAGEYYGGCYVWLSLDGGVSYGDAPIGTATPANAGTITSSLPASEAGTIDTTHTLGTDLTSTGGELPTGSNSTATNLGDLCFVDGEMICYGNATLSATSKFNLTYLVRGAYQNGAVPAHSSGGKFAFIDSNIFTYTFTANNIGVNAYLKFQSFNVWGNGVQSLASCTPYSWTIEGSTIGAPLISTIANLTGSPVTITGANGTTYPGINLTWNPVSDLTVTSVVVTYQVHGNIGPVMTASFLPNGQAGTLTAGVQPGTEYNISATITTNPVRAVTSTAVIHVTTNNVVNMILPGSITTAELGSACVTATQLAAAAVTPTALATAAVLASALASGSVTGPAIAADSVTAPAIAADAIVAGAIAAGAIDATDIIVNDIIVTGHLQADTATSVAVATGSSQTLIISPNTAAGSYYSPVLASLSYTSGDDGSGSSQLEITAAFDVSMNVAIETGYFLMFIVIYVDGVEERSAECSPIGIQTNNVGILLSGAYSTAIAKVLVTTTPGAHTITVQGEYFSVITNASGATYTFINGIVDVLESLR